MCKVYHFDEDRQGVYYVDVGMLCLRESAFLTVKG
jgi:hypothetical protein